MKIALMGAWNTDSGASIHTELLGRSFVRMGHKVVVFTFFKDSFHGTNIVGKDEDYVIRCFSLGTEKKPVLKVTPFLREDYEVFVVEDLGMLPQDELAKIFHWIKRKAVTVTVIHDGNLKEDPSFYQFDWDAIVCFDKRYYDFLKLVYPEELLHIIPYPFYPWNPGDREKSRKKLGLSPDKKIILLFGPTSKFGAEKINVLRKISEKYPVLILVVTNNYYALEKWEPLKEKYPDLIEIREESPDIKRLYEYLYASDLLLYNKPTIPGRVTVASTVYQCMGSGCPVVALKSSFVEMFGDAVYQYENDEELFSAIESIFKKDERFHKVYKNMKKMVMENSAEKIAEEFIKLFKKLKEVRHETQKIREKSYTLAH